MLRSWFRRGLSRSCLRSRLVAGSGRAALLELDGSLAPVWSPDEVAAPVSRHAGPVQACSQAGPQLSAGVRERVWFR